eukprot:12790_1
MLLLCLLLLCAISNAGESTLNWGTYRPGYYFGLRARHPRSPLFGFMWYDAGKYEGLGQSRHACQDSDKLGTYGWYRHNADDFGQQIIFDPMTKLQLTTSFMKFKYQDTEEDAWLSVIDARTMKNGPDIASGIVGTVWYVVSGEHANDTADNPVLSAHDPNMFVKKKKYAKGRVVQLDGTMYPDQPTDAQPYTYSITQIMDEDNQYGPAIRPTKKGKMKSTTMDERTYVTGVHLKEENKWRAKSIFTQLMEVQAKKLYKKSYKIIEKLYPDPQQQQQIYSQFSPNLKHGIIGNKTYPPNIFLSQNYLVAPFRIYYVYLPTKDVTIESLADLPPHINSKENINLYMRQQIKTFDARFEKTFNIIVRPKPPSEDEDEENTESFDAATGRKYISPGEMQLAHYALSNLVGGVGYWYGNQIWQLRPNDPPGYTPDMMLLSAVPSRSFFPRGFLWDEGFHELIIGLWDMDLSINIIESWLNNMNDLGWIAREQIIGDEARSRVPQEFQIQRPHIANPPTMFLAIEALLKRYGTGEEEDLRQILCTNEGDEEMESVEIDSDGTQQQSDEDCKVQISDTRNKMKAFLQEHWDALRLHFDWYRITQKSPSDENERSFRWNGRQKDHNLPSGLDDYPRYPNVTANEGHVDMHCWMIVLYRVMSEFAQFLGEDEMARQWKDDMADITQALDEYHWDGDANAYQDYAMVPQVLEGEDWSNASGPIHKVFVNHIGYVSCFPFLLQVMDPLSPHLVDVLRQLRDEEGMWSEYGLRSLAKNDALYGEGEDYWRGAIWMNMNYLAVKALHDYRDFYKDIEGKTEEQQKVLELLTQLYNELRENLIRNLYNEFAKFGFLYENYNGDTGMGQRSKPFTGWSALIVNIITEIYP